MTDSYTPPMSMEHAAQMLERINVLATEACERWDGLIVEHDDQCHTKHAGCLAESILEIMEEIEVVLTETPQHE